MGLIDHISRTGEIPASSFQERLHFLHTLQPENTGSNTFSVYEIDGAVNEQWLQQSIERVVQNHEIFRTTFKQVEDRITQVITPADVSVLLGRSELDALDHAEMRRELWRHAWDMSRRPVR